MVKENITSKRYNKSWFDGNYPYQVIVTDQKTYTYYRSVVRQMGIDRPEYNRYVNDDGTQIYGFQKKKDAFYFALVVGGEGSSVQVLHVV